MLANLFTSVAAMGLAAVNPTSTPSSAVSFCASAERSIDAAVAKTLQQGSPGMIVAVADGDRPIFVKGYGTANLEHGAPVLRSTVFKLASVTKQFTAAAVLQLAEEGRLRLEDKLSVYVPELEQADQVTLYQLLVQTSGIPDYAEDPAGSKSTSVPRTPEEMLSWISGLEPAFHFKPGTRWAYSNSNYVLLGLVLERMERKPLAEVFKERLFRPAGLKNTAFDDPADVVSGRADGYRRSKTAPSGYENSDWISYTVPGAAGGLRTTADDLLAWNAALFGGRILKSASLQKMTAPGLLTDGRTTKLGMPKEWQEGLNSDYGMGVFVTPTQFGTRVWHSGDIKGFSTWLARYPERGVSIALMINSESADMDKDAIEKAAFESLGETCG